MLDFFRNQRARKIAKWINHKGRVLDIGCGNGRFLQKIQKYGQIEGFGIEMPGGSAERAKLVLGDRLKVGVLEEEDFDKAYFDAITLFHVFEHLTDPKGYLENISRMIKPGGVLYMSFPNIDSIQAKLFKGDWLHLDPPRHLFLFSPEAFKEQMSHYGFEIIHAKHFNIEYNPFGFQQSLLNKIYAKREVLYESLKGNKAYTSEYSKWNLRLQNLFFKLTAPLFIISDWFSASFGRGATVEFMMRKARPNSDKANR
ncbi:MAG: class I SAM-dependent methyltransferase [Maribacter sp.]|nr:class I SAM-dependent methyltransferase [Maribacter sp.]